MAPSRQRRGRVLYVSYDGMTDPLGESQVIPYVLGLTDRGYAFHLLSFEKPDRFARSRSRVGGLLREHGVEWVPLTYTARPPLLAKAYDQLRLKRAVRSLHREFAFDLVHCRSYQAADAALALKKRAGVPYLFDMRGFWVDERVEGGIWDPALPHYRALYRYFKGRERAYLEGAAGVVSLTEAAKTEMSRWEGVSTAETVVIPCSVDGDLFRPSGDARVRARIREELSVPSEAVALVYLGSIGTWYMLDEMMRFFAKVLVLHEDARFVMLTRHDPVELKTVADGWGVPADRVIVREVARTEVPSFLEAMDVSVFFIRPTYSKTASCPTKLGEVMAMGVPSVCNSGIGDVGQIVSEHQAGIVIDDTGEASLDAAARSIDRLMASPREPMIRGANSYFSLDGAIDEYAGIYERILNQRDSGT